VTPEINALSTIMIALVTVGVITASLVMKRNIARMKADEARAVQG